MKRKINPVEYQIPMTLRKRLYNLGKGEVGENELVIDAIKFYITHRNAKKLSPKPEPKE